MTRILAGFTSLTCDFSAKRLLLSACASLAIVLTNPGPARAAVTGTAGFETRLQKLATIDHALGSKVTVYWDDGSHSDGLLSSKDKTKNVIVYGTHVYVTAGVYTISIEYRGHLEKKETATTTATISEPKDFIILSIGDSVASGEGDPVVPDLGFWDDPGSDYKGHSQLCHRSSSSGPSLAVQEIAKTNSLTFLHVACSGNTVEDAIQQLKAARKRLTRIDLLLISAGANDMHGAFGHGFGAVVKHCITTECSKDKQFAQDIHDSIEGNPDRDGYPGLDSLYDDLDQEIHCIDYTTHEPDCDYPDTQIPKLVLITDYHDPTHDKDGNFPKNPIRCADPGITAKEFEFLFDNVMQPLNKHVEDSPLEHPLWHDVNGIESAFKKHGLCAENERWVDTIPDSKKLQNDTSGTGHPNYVGQNTFRDQIYKRAVQFNPPVTTASATAGDSSYSFGTWTDQDVVVTLAAQNAIKESGVGATYYAVDNPNCAPGDTGDCSPYGGPFTLSTTGQHMVTFFSANLQGAFEASQSIQIWIDKNPSLSATPTQQTVHRGENAAYAVTVGHLGWDNDTVNLSCSAGPGAACTMVPTSVSLDPDDPTATATVSTVGGAMMMTSGVPLPQPVAPAGQGNLRMLLILATAVIFPGAAFFVRQRWVRGSGLAALALIGLLCISCGGGARIRRSSSPTTYDVVITGVSGDTSHTCHVALTVQ